MSQFEFLYALFGLLLGFILVEVLSGLTRTVRALSPSDRGEKSEIQIGWLTPLLGALTMLNVVVWWGNLWSLQNTLPVGFDYDDRRRDPLQLLLFSRFHDLS